MKGWREVRTHAHQLHAQAGFTLWFRVFITVYRLKYFASWLHQTIILYNI